MTTHQKLVVADAKNRAVRTFVTGVAIDVAVAIALVLTTTLATADGWGSLEWAALSFSFAKSVVQAIASYVLRRFVDGSKIPTPTVPAKTGE